MRITSALIHVDSILHKHQNTFSRRPVTRERHAYQTEKWGKNICSHYVRSELTRNRGYIQHVRSQRHPNTTTCDTGQTAHHPQTTQSTGWISYVDTSILGERLSSNSSSTVDNEQYFIQAKMGFLRVSTEQLDTFVFAISFVFV